MQRGTHCPLAKSEWIKEFISGAWVSFQFVEAVLHAERDCEMVKFLTIVISA